MTPVFQVVKNSIALMFGQVSGVLLNLLAIALIARYLPLKTFGTYGFILAICVTVSMLGDMGINRIAIREIARENGSGRGNEIKVLTATFMCKAILSALAFLVIVLSFWLTGSPPQVMLGSVICGLATIGKIIGDIPEAVFKAYERMIFNAYLKILEDASYVVGIVIVVTFDLGLNGVFSALLCSAVLRIVFGFGMLSRRFILPEWEWDLPYMKWLFKEAVPIGLNRIFRKAGLRVDTIILKLLRTKEEVGIFHGAYRIILIASVIPFNMTEALFPSFSRYANGSGNSIKVAFEKSFKFLLVIVLPVIFAVFMTSEHITRLLLGNKFLAATSLIQVLSLLLGCRFFTILCTKVLHAANQQGRASWASGITLAVNVALDFVLIYFWGYMGAAVATLISDVVLVVMSMYYVKKYVCSYELQSAVTKPIAFFSMACIAGWALSGLNLPFALFAGITIYILGLFLSRVFDEAELELFREGVQRMKVKLQKVTATNTK